MTQATNVGPSEVPDPLADALKILDDLASKRSGTKRGVELKALSESAWAQLNAFRRDARELETLRAERHGYLTQPPYSESDRRTG